MGSGAWVRKIDSQPRIWVITPPIAGPMAAPMMPAPPQIASDLDGEPVRLVRRASEDPRISAPPIAWIDRAVTSTANDGATPQVIDAAANSKSPAIATALGRCRARYAPGTAASAKTML